MNNATRLILAALMGAAALSACSRPAEEAPLTGARLGGPFSLIDQDGRRVTDRDFAGRYRLMYFGYTFCPDVCPTSLQRLAKGLKLFEGQDAARAAKIQPIFVTVDPARDTPAILKAYVAAFHPRLIGLTGSEAEIAAVAKSYAVSYAKRQDAGTTGYLMDHMSQAMLFGPKGEPIALVPQDGTPEEVAQSLNQWVK